MFVSVVKQAPQDWRAIFVFLARQGFEVDEDAGVEQFQSGLANLNYLITLKGGKKVVFRRPPEGQAPPGAYNLSREFTIYANLGRHLSFVPKGLVLCEDLTVIGVPFFIMEFVEGISIVHEVPEPLNNIPLIGDKLCRLLMESLAELHQLNPTAVGLDTIGRPEGFLRRQIDGWKKRGNLAFGPDDRATLERVHDWLRGNEPEHQPISVVHHDYKFDNVLIDPECLTVAGVIDWEMATLGNPFFDMVLTLTQWGGDGEHAVYEKLRMMPCDSDGWWSRRKALAVYLEKSGLQLPERSLFFYWILGLVRQAVAYAQLGNLYQRESAMKNKETSHLKVKPEEFCQLSTEVLAHADKLIQAGRLDW